MREQGIMATGGKKIKKQRMMAQHNANYQHPQMFNHDVIASYNSDQGQNINYIQEADEAEDASENDIKDLNINQN